MPSSSTASITPPMLPLPPAMLTPPRMTMVITSSSQPMAIFGRVLFRGLASVILGDQAYTGYPQLLIDWGQGYFFDIIPRPFVILLVFAVLFAVLLHATSWGRRIFAIGSAISAFSLKLKVLSARL